MPSRSSTQAVEGHGNERWRLRWIYPINTFAANDGKRRARDTFLACQRVKTHYSTRIVAQRTDKTVPWICVQQLATRSSVWTGRAFASGRRRVGNHRKSKAICDSYQN